MEHDRVRVAGVAGAADALCLERHRAGARTLAVGEQAVDLTPDHQTDDLLDVELAYGGVTHQRPVAQHRGSIADLHHLLEPVGDEHHGDALGLEPAHDGEQALDLLVGESRGRLVHDHELGRSRHGPRDLDHLLLGHRQVGDQPARVDVEADLPGQRPGAAVQRRPVDAAQPHRQAADEHVLGDRERGDQVEFLIDGDDAQLLGGVRTGEADLRPIEGDVARVGRLGTGQDLEQRALAGTVLAQERVDLPSADGEVHPAQGLHAGKALGDPGHVEEGAAAQSREHPPEDPLPYFSSPRRSALSRLSLVIMTGVSSTKSLSGFFWSLSSSTMTCIAFLL